MNRKSFLQKLTAWLAVLPMGRLLRRRESSIEVTRVYVRHQGGFTEYIMADGKCIGAANYPTLPFTGVA